MNLTLEQRIKRLEDRELIRELVAVYCVVVDGRDIEGLGECFCEEGSMRSKDGVMDALGRAAVVEQFHGRFAVLGPSNHFTHDHAIWFDENDPSHAFGLVNSHAEVVRADKPMLAALRYEDEYRFEAGRWRFADRLLSFFYYVEPHDYVAALTSPLRNRAYAEPKSADIPEGQPTYADYYRSRPRK
jgi:hypothetical protein